MSFADWIMTITHKVAPRTRATWTAAMLGEFAAQKDGRTGWALGCLMTAIGWRLSGEVVYLFVVTAAILSTMHGLWDWWSWLFFSWTPHGPLHGFVRLAFYLEGIVPFVITIFALGMWRPDRVLTTSLLALIIHVIDVYMIFDFVMHTRFGYIHFSDLPPVVGELSRLTCFLVSGWLGAMTRKAISARKLAV